MQTFVAAAEILSFFFSFLYLHRLTRYTAAGNLIHYLIVSCSRKVEQCCVVGKEGFSVHSIFVLILTFFKRTNNLSRLCVLFSTCPTTALTNFKLFFHLLLHFSLSELLFLRGKEVMLLVLRFFSFWL